MTEISLQAFHALSAAERMAVIKAGTTIVNETASEAQERASRVAAVRDAAITAGAIPRAQFDAMNPTARMSFIQAGGKLID
jgi:hypothetical protein